MTAKEKIRDRILIAILGEPSLDSSEARGLTDEIMQLIEPEEKKGLYWTEEGRFFMQMKGAKS